MHYLWLTSVLQWWKPRQRRLNANHVGNLIGDLSDVPLAGKMARTVVHRAQKYGCHRHTMPRAAQQMEAGKSLYECGDRHTSCATRHSPCLPNLDGLKKKTRTRRSGFAFFHSTLTQLVLRHGQSMLNFISSTGTLGAGVKPTIVSGVPWASNSSVRAGPVTPLVRNAPPAREAGSGTSVAIF